MSPERLRTNEEPPNVERSTTRRRIPGLRTRASKREIARRFQWLIADERAKDPEAPEEVIERRADTTLTALRARSPAVAQAMERLAPSSAAPPPHEVMRSVELAAAVSVRPVSRLLQSISLTPSARGPISDLSGATASLVVMAATTGASVAGQSFDALRDSSALRWALRFPRLAESRSQRYRNILTITGRAEQRGHHPGEALVANLELLRQMAQLRDAQNRPLHPRLGQVGIVDATRLRAPVEQRQWPRSPEHLETLCRPGMDLVAPSTYDHNGQFDTRIGWKAVVIVDQATMLPIVWTLASGDAVEHRVLLDVLLPKLFELWPDCPMDTLVGDAAYDNEETCRICEQRYSLHPVFTRQTSRSASAASRRGREVSVTNGQPSCVCGPMEFHRREGFYTAERRLADGTRRGAVAPDVKNARIRWRCPHGLCDEVSLWAHASPREHTFWPRVTGTAALRGPAAERRALEIYRNGVESVFAGVKRTGIGTFDGRALWARDTGVAWLLGLHLLLATARRMAHETGDYEFFRDEHREIQLRAGHIPLSQEQADELQGRRPEHLRWDWPAPGRAASSNLAA
jgi:hypothetical protein